MAMMFLYPDQHSVSDPGADQLIQVPEKKSSHVTDAEGKEGNERASESSDVCINICVTLDYGCCCYYCSHSYCVVLPHFYPQQETY